MDPRMHSGMSYFHALLLHQMIPSELLGHMYPVLHSSIANNPGITCTILVPGGTGTESQVQPDIFFTFNFLVLVIRKTLPDRYKIC